VINYKRHFPKGADGFHQSYGFKRRKATLALSTWSMRYPIRSQNITSTPANQTENNRRSVVVTKTQRIKGRIGELQMIT
jgi:hypothetical protein